MNKPKTPAERVRDSERRKRDKGLVKTWVWVDPGDRKALREYASILTNKRRLNKTNLKKGDSVMVISNFIAHTFQRGKFGIVVRIRKKCGRALIQMQTDEKEILPFFDNEVVRKQ